MITSEGAFSTVLIGSRDVDAIIKDPRVKAVTLTGSEPAGRAVASSAAAEVKKAVLELGGSERCYTAGQGGVRVAFIRARSSFGC